MELMKTIHKIKTYLSAFHENEDGIEALQVVMIIAVAAIALILVKVFWGELAEFTRGMWDQVVGEGEWHVEGG